MKLLQFVIAVVAVPFYVTGLLVGVLIRPLYAGFLTGYYYFEAQEIKEFNDRAERIEQTL